MKLRHINDKALGIGRLHGLSAKPALFLGEALMPGTMNALIFVERGRIELRQKPIPEIGPNDALLRVTLTTICDTDVHILKGEYPVAPGLTIGHEPVGVIEKLGANVNGYNLFANRRDGVLKVAIAP